VIAQLVDIEFFLADAATERRDQSAHFRGRQHFIKTRFFHI
jgi:hypothetical protein